MIRNLKLQTKTLIKPVNKLFSHQPSQLSQLPEFIEAQQYYQTYKYPQAIVAYKKTQQILTAAKILQDTPQHNLNMTKLIGTLYLNGNYREINAMVNESQFKINKIRDKNICRFIWLVDGLSSEMCQNLANCLNQKQIPAEERELKLMGRLLMSNSFKKVNETCQKIGQPQFPFLIDISTKFNNSLKYKQILASLLKPEKIIVKSEEQLTKQTLIQSLNYTAISPGLQILYHLIITLTNRISYATPDYKSEANSRLNSILTQYQQISQKPIFVYQPLLNILCNLVKEKQYMSAEGIIGHIKSGESGLYVGENSGVYGTSHKQEGLQDRILIDNIYRMLVCRANNEDLEIGWSKVGPFKPGLFLSQRLIQEIIKCLDSTQSISGIFI